MAGRYTPLVLTPTHTAPTATSNHLFSLSRVWLLRTPRAVARVLTAPERSLSAYFGISLTGMPIAFATPLP